MEYKYMLPHLSDEELVDEYVLQLTNEADAQEKRAWGSRWYDYRLNYSIKS